MPNPSARFLVCLVPTVVALGALSVHASESSIVSWRHNLMGVVAVSSSDQRQNPYKDGAALTIRFVRGWDKLDDRTREEKIQVVTWYAIGPGCALMKQGRTVEGNHMTGIAKCFPDLDLATFYARYYPPFGNNS